MALFLSYPKIVSATDCLKQLQDSELNEPYEKVLGHAVKLAMKGIMYFPSGQNLIVNTDAVFPDMSRISRSGKEIDAERTRRKFISNIHPVLKAVFPPYRKSLKKISK